MKRAIFIDRDGVICEDRNLFYRGAPITKPEHFKWVKNAREALKILSRMEFLLIVVTNQSLINRGLLSVEDFHRINQPINEELRRYEKSLDGLYFCPHLQEENCECRKPKIGMLLRAREEMGIDLAQSWVIGDKTSDVKMGKDAGCRTILVLTGYGGRDYSFKVSPDFTEKDLYDAALRISG